MNIVVLGFNSKVFVRPDTTWERDNEDFYVPEFIDALSWAPVLFARISKPGRSILPKFAPRYYDSVGYGALLYPEDLIDGSTEGFASACCLDHTSFLGFPTFHPSSLKDEKSVFDVQKDGSPLFRYDSGSCEMIENAIGAVSRYCYLRIGDIIAIEIAPRKMLARRENGAFHITGTFHDETVLDFETIF